MSHMIRFFTTSTLKNLVPVQNELLQAGYKVRPAGTNQLKVFYDPAFPPFNVDMTQSTNIKTQRVIASFLELLSAGKGRGYKEVVLMVLTRAQSLIATDVPDDYYALQSDALDVLIDNLAWLSEGLFQVDGEGFYDAGKLIYEL